MGKSDGTQKVTTTAELPAWYESAAQNAINFANTATANIAQPYMQNTVAPIDPITGRAISLTNQNVGSTNAAFGQAQQGAAGVMNYNPMMIGANYTPQNVNAGSQQYGYNPMNVSGGSFLSGNINAYMNPFVQNVEQAALANMNQGYRQALNTIGDSAINASAFGGSRQGVAEGTAASEFARQYGDLSASLRNQAYTAGTDLMGQDMSRGLQAQLANQQAGMSNAQFGANIGMQNYDRQLQAGLANQQAAFQGAQLNQQAQQSNQQAGLQGAQMNLSGANALGDLAAQGQQAYLSQLQAAITAGQINQQQAQQLLAQREAQYNAMRQVPIEQLNIMLSALGGTQVPKSSTTTTPTSGNFLTGAAGGALAGMTLGWPGAIAGGILGGIASA